MINTIQEFEDEEPSVDGTGVDVVERLCDKELSLVGGGGRCMKYLREYRKLFWNVQPCAVHAGAFFNGLNRPMAR